jgi:RNA polymerase sigma-70 factor, ECF subfamily
VRAVERYAAENNVESRDAILTQWAETVLPKALAYARSLLHSTEDGEDVVHDVLCRMLNHPEYDFKAHGEKILFRSITNACINRWQRKKKVLSLDFAADDGAPLLDALPSSQRTNPAETVMNRELHNQVGEALATLPPNQRAALELKVMGYTLKDIAGMLETSVSNAGVLIHRARKAMTDCMASVLAERNAT